MVQTTMALMKMAHAQTTIAKMTMAHWLMLLMTMLMLTIETTMRS
jgi:hypothetical protein